MNRDLRYQGNDPKEREFVECIGYGTNTTTIQLTLMVVLEATISNIGARTSISFHIIGAAGAEFASLPAFEKMLHLLPSLVTLQLSFVGPDVSTDLEGDAEHRQPDTLPCYNMCTEMGRSAPITTWKGAYHAFANTEFYKPPDLAAAFHSGFSVDERANWYPTIEYLAHAPHPTLFYCG